MIRMPPIPRPPPIGWGVILNLVMYGVQLATLCLEWKEVKDRQRKKRRRRKRSWQEEQRRTSHTNEGGT